MQLTALESAPREFYRCCNVLMHAQLHWTSIGGSFQLLLILLADVMRYVNLRRQGSNPSRLRAGHFLFYCRGGSRNVNVQVSGENAHGREHARSKCRRDEVSRREALTTALIVCGGIRGEPRLRRTMHCPAVQVSLVFHLNRYHLSMIKGGTEGLPLIQFSNQSRIQGALASPPAIPARRPVGKAGGEGF